MRSGVLLLALIVGSTGFVRGADAENVSTAAIRISEEQLDLVEASLAMALESSIPGLQASAAQTVRDLKPLVNDRDFSSLIIPLMRVLKGEDNEIGPRVLAALALHQLDSERGDFAISRLPIFTDQEQLKHVCSWLTYCTLSNAHGVNGYCP